MSSGLNPRKRKALTRLYNLYMDGFNQQQLSAHFGFPRNSIDRMLYTGTISYSSAEKINAVKADPEPTEKIRRQHAVEEFPHFMAILNDRDIAVRMLAKAYGMNEKAIGKSISSANGPSRVKAARKRQELCELILARGDASG